MSKSVLEMATEQLAALAGIEGDSLTWTDIMLGVQAQYHEREALRATVARLEGELRARIVPGDVVRLTVPPEYPFDMTGLDCTGALVRTIDLEDDGRLVYLLRLRRTGEDAGTCYEDWFGADLIEPVRWTAEEIETAKREGDALFARVFPATAPAAGSVRLWEREPKSAENMTEAYRRALKQAQRELFAIGGVYSVGAGADGIHVGCQEASRESVPASVDGVPVLVRVGEPPVLHAPTAGSEGRGRTVTVNLAIEPDPVTGERRIVQKEPSKRPAAGSEGAATTPCLTCGKPVVVQPGPGDYFCSGTCQQQRPVGGAGEVTNA